MLDPGLVAVGGRSPGTSTGAVVAGSDEPELRWKSDGHESRAKDRDHDWSGVGPDVREYLDFPPFEPGHLDRSLRKLAELVAST